jgi:hypothetical protein
MFPKVVSAIYIVLKYIYICKNNNIKFFHKLIKKNILVYFIKLNRFSLYISNKQKRFSMYQAIQQIIEGILNFCISNYFLKLKKLFSQKALPRKQRLFELFRKIFI